MQITEEHLQRISKRLEQMYIRDDEISDIAHDYFISGVGLFKMELELVLKAKSEDDLKKSEEFANAAMEIFNNDELSSDEKVEKIMIIIRGEKKKEKNSKSLTYIISNILKKR